MTDKDLRELYCKVGLLGLSDLRRLAPIGDIGYLNGIDFYRRWYSKKPCFETFCRTTLLEWVLEAFHEQRERFGFTIEGYSSGYRGTDHHSYCPELGLRWSVDSGD